MRIFSFSPCLGGAFIASSIRARDPNGRLPQHLQILPSTANDSRRMRCTSKEVMSNYIWIAPARYEKIMNLDNSENQLSSEAHLFRRRKSRDRVTIEGADRNRLFIGHGSAEPIPLVPYRILSRLIQLISWLYAINVAQPQIIERDRSRKCRGVIFSLNMMPRLVSPSS